MQISKVPETGCGECGTEAADYRAASDLFDLMTKNTQLDNTDEYSLSAQDLVLLYQNIDVGTRLMNEVSHVTIRKPNQHVETVVYNDQDSGSDCSEIYTPNDNHHAFTLNQERVEYLKDKSLENLLCHKFGGFELNTSNLSRDYDKNFLFQDPQIKNQLQNLNLMSSSTEFGNLFSTSLIDYICCKRLEDNYNFYMDNVIRYVQNTIEQLKRISNGDYLTDRAKQKWLEANSKDRDVNSTKFLAMSTSIPLQVECKTKKNATWDEIVHSEIDVRSLSKILEKKIVVEIPKSICGSFRLFSKRYADNLIISCQKEKPDEEEPQSRVDVVLQLKRSQTGQEMSNINSILVLKTTPALPDLRGKEILPLLDKESTDEPTVPTPDNVEEEPTVTFIQLMRNINPIVTGHKTTRTGMIVKEITTDDNDEDLDKDSYAGTTDYPISDPIASHASIQYSSESSLAIIDPFDKSLFPLRKTEEKTYHLISPDELHMTMRKLNMRNSVLKESGEDTASQCTSKRRSPVRKRIKSPYENKSLLMEEKKRKRLLEIRERREKRKIALSESCKISKHKYGKGGMMPQASSSVTKLSITNKSFYNSIYGQNVKSENKPKIRKSSKNTSEMSSTLDETQEDSLPTPLLSPDKNNKKYINRSYYLDDAETEVMLMQLKKNKDMSNSRSASESIVSNEFNASLEILQELMAPSDANLTQSQSDVMTFGDTKYQSFPDTFNSSLGKPLLPVAESILPPTPEGQSFSKKNSSGDECRKSIDQLYDLINKFKKPTIPKDTKSKHTTDTDFNETNFQGSESGANAKYSTNTSNHSGSPVKNNIQISKTKSSKQQPRLSKVVVSSKSQSPKLEGDKARKESNKSAVVSTPFKGPLPENPLKAISQLLHEFDNVQKNRLKSSPSARSPDEAEAAVNDVKSVVRQNYNRRKSRIDQHIKDENERRAPPTNLSPKDRKLRPMTPMELARTPHKLLSSVDDRGSQKKVADIIDEAKEARGEAVRGPSKNYSRLNSLAQPKKSYVQAHQEQFQNKHGKNVLTERLQKVTGLPATAPLPERNVASPTTANTKNKWKKNGSEALASVKQRAPSVSQLDQSSPASARKRWSAGSSPENVTRLGPTTRKHSPSEACETHGKAPEARPAAAAGAPPGLRCRVPLLPRDTDYGAYFKRESERQSRAEEATALGDKLHRMVDSAVAPPAAAPHLAALAECPESPRSDSDYCVNVVECPVATAVSALGSCSSGAAAAAEMEQLETALYTHLSGAFQKRLRLKNLTLTPKPSMQQVFLLQSGDAGSLIIKSNHKLKTDESVGDLKSMAVLSNTHLDWTFAQLPVQISTVGYAVGAPDVPGKVIEIPSTHSGEVAVQWPSQSSQCLCGPAPAREPPAQADVGTQSAADSVTVSVGSADPEPLDAPPAGCREPHQNSLATVHEAATDARPAVEEKVVPAEEPAAAEEAIGYTTSLDMLVGLLTEIQKITCQSHIVPGDRHDATDMEISNAVSVKRTHMTYDFISMSSLENLRQLESNASIYSYYLSNDERSGASIESLMELKRNSMFTEDSVDLRLVAGGGMVREDVAVGASRPTVLDKEVSVDLCGGHAGACCPSLSAAVGSLVVSTTMVPISESPSHYSLAVSLLTPAANVTSSPVIIELPQIETEARHALSRHRKDLKKRCSSTLPASSIDVKRKSLLPAGEMTYRVRNIDLDPMLKIKRDLLVSMYSILVLTVFAALSFPELLVFQS